MRKATALGFSLLLLIIFMSFTRNPGAKPRGATDEALFELLPGSTDFVLILDVKKLMKIDAFAKIMVDTQSKEGIFGFIKTIGIDPSRDINSVGFGAPASEYWRRFLLRRPTRQSLIENVSIVFNLENEKPQLQNVIREKVPEARADIHNGVTVFSNLAAEDSGKWIHVAVLDASHIVLGSENGVRAVIDVYQKKAEPLSKSHEMNALIEQANRSGMAWCSASLPAELFKEVADRNGRFANFKWHKGVTLAFDDKDAGILVEFQLLGGTAEQNAANASQLNGLRAYGMMHLTKVPALKELLNAIEITSGADQLRLAASASHETVEKLLRLAQTKASAYTKHDEDEPEQDNPGVPGSAQDQEAGMLAAAFYERILDQAEEMHTAIMSGDLDKYIGYMFPQLITQAGGAAALKQAIEPGLAEMQQIIEKISVGTISPVVSEADGLAACVPIEMNYRIKGTRLIQISYYVAFSTDMGLTWKFMSFQGQPQQDRLVRQLFPKLTSRIALPKCGQFTPFW